MQTLNVGAGRTDQEYQAAEESRREELRSEVQTSAFYFFVAAIMAGLGSGVLIIRLPFIVNIGAIDLLFIYGRDLLHGNILLFRMAGTAWIVLVLLLALAARNNHRWAFWGRHHSLWSRFDLHDGAAERLHYSGPGGSWLFHNAVVQRTESPRRTE
jgi:hypothetical protein